MALQKSLRPAALAIAIAALAGASRAEEADKPLGVVELFTSQGCNSCPPADELFGQLAARDDVVALAYHVAHYLTALLVDGQYALAALSDPFALGWNLFGTADMQIEAGIVAGADSAWWLWNLQAGAIILGHLELVDHVHITAATVVTRSILKPGQYSGLFPFDDNASWEKNAATLRQLHSLRERLRALEKKS